MKEILEHNTTEVTGCVIAVVGYVLRQIDLKRIKLGKKPLFAWFDVIKH